MRPARKGRRSLRSFQELKTAARRTIFPMASQIALYEEMTALSSRMVEAARAKDWNSLIQLEQSVMALRHSMASDDDVTRLSPDESEIKRNLIQRILDDDAEIRRHTEPWMEQVERFLGNEDCRCKPVNNACGSSS